MRGPGEEACVSGIQNRLKPFEAQFPILRWFRFEHLREGEPQRVSMECAALAAEMVESPDLQANPSELAAGLRDLMRAKDCFVRAALPKEA